MFNVKILIASTRPGRKGPAVASWIVDLAKAYPDFEIELFDLAEINLPFLDEPNHPRLQQYQHEHTKTWSRKVANGDAFIFVTAEYNYGYPAPLKNALDYLYHEWTYKPVAFVSYGGIAGGTRSVQMLKQVVTALKMMPVQEAVNIPFFTKYLDKDGNFVADETLQKAATDMFKELTTWAGALKEIRLKKESI